MSSVSERGENNMFALEKLQHAYHWSLWLLTNRTLEAKAFGFVGAYRCVSLGIVFNINYRHSWNKTSLYSAIDVSSMVRSPLNSQNDYWTSLFRLSNECQFDIFLKANTLSLPFHRSFVTGILCLAFKKVFKGSDSQWIAYSPAFWHLFFYISRSHDSFKIFFVI